MVKQSNKSTAEFCFLTSEVQKAEKTDWILITSCFVRSNQKKIPSGTVATLRAKGHKHRDKHPHKRLQITFRKLPLLKSLTEDCPLPASMLAAGEFLAFPPSKYLNITLIHCISSTADWFVVIQEVSLA